jgi:putative phosphoesterase
MKDVRIVLVSDHHGDRKSLQFIRETYADYDYLIHLGDSDLTVEEMDGFLCVCGNHDLQYHGKVPDYRILEIGAHRIYLCHGHKDFLSYYHYKPMVMHAKAHGCDTVFFGHVHTYDDEVIDGVRLLNPGSIRHNRDGSRASYMLVEISEEEITVTKKEYVKVSQPGFLEKLIRKLLGG